MEFIDKTSAPKKGTDCIDELLESCWNEEEKSYKEANYGDIKTDFRARFIGVLLEEQKGNCCYCLRSLTPKEVTLEHIIPKSKGGTNKKLNLTLSHSFCNQLKESARKDFA